mgnify:CR=1 FL=1
MWNLSKLEIHGLQSFGDAEIDFVEGEVVVIYGKNLDVGQEVKYIESLTTAKLRLVSWLMMMQSLLKCLLRSQIRVLVKTC